MDHLHPSVRHYLGKSDAERIYFLRAERWIPYDEAARVLTDLEVLFHRPRVSRMPGVLLVGSSNQGKSTILKKYRMSHPAVNDPTVERATMPVLMVECPPGPDERRFYHSLLDGLNAPYRYNSRIEEKHRQVKHLLGQMGTRVLVLDEIHNVLVGSSVRQRYFLNVLKYVSNDFLLPIVLAGNSDAKTVLTTDDQLARRFRTMILPKWQDKKAFTMLLNSFERLLPLKKPSRLNSESIVNELFALSEKILGEVAYLLTEAACAAVLSGEEQITLKGIRAVDFIPSSERRDGPDEAQAA